MTDIWGMSRSVELWIKPEEFSPERFLNEEADVLMRGTEVRGDITHYKFMAFGAGKRACAGYNVGKLMLSLMVSRLVWHFEWKLHSVDLYAAPSQPNCSHIGSSCFNFAIFLHPCFHYIG
eukprot:TRINITY_DN10413_c0_g1_i1.p3 TRINITY_DN10413_c0_g1~~TRINITY_DN10413_c0_g1_i1.p3  ORF type:complete len:120 (+),score=17.64 TRINITY_DN10413_c0_g1_i1:589-948(+)